MSSIYSEMTTMRQFGLKDAWRGHFNRDVADFTTKAFVVIPDLDPDLELGPCFWMPRDAVSLPGKGDDCLVIFDNDREPWIVMWWPF